MKRREFIALLGGAVATTSVGARAQQPKMLRVGYSGMLPRGAPHYDAFEKRMAELGYQQGRNFTFEYIQSPSFEGYDLTYRELVARKVDILLAAGNEPALRAAQAARAAEGATSIVFIALDFDPVERGEAGSRSRPGNNSTGIFVSQLELAGKRVELLRETFPRARRVGLFWDAASREQAMAAAAAATSLGFEPHPAGIEGATTGLCGCADAHGSIARRTGHAPCKPAHSARSRNPRPPAAGAPQPVDLRLSRGDGGGRAHELRRQPRGCVSRHGERRWPGGSEQQRGRRSHAGAVAFPHRVQSQDRKGARH